MVAPAPDDAIVIERVIPTPAPPTVGRRTSVRRNGVRVADTARPRLAHNARSAGSASPSALCSAVGGRDRGAAGVSAGRSATPICRRAPIASSRARSHRRPSAARFSIATATSSPTASTRTRSTPFRPKSPTPSRPRQRSVRRARATVTARIGGRSPTASARASHFAYVRRQVWPDQARRVAALQLEGIGFIKENQPPYPNSDLASHVLGYVGLDNVGLGGIEGTYDSLDPRQAGHGARADRRAPAGVQPSRAAADRGRVARADNRRVPAARRRARVACRAWSRVARPADRPSSWIRTPARSWRWPTARRSIRTSIATRAESAPQSRDSGSVRAGIDVQDRHRQRRVRREGRSRPTRSSTRSAGNIRFGSRVISDDHNYGVLSFAR